MIEFRMPSLGADMEDGTLVEWRVSPGDAVERGQVVCVVDTQKGAIDVETWEAGTVARLVAAPGEKLPVGAPLALLAEGGEDWQAVAAATSGQAAAKAAQAEVQRMPAAGAPPADAGRPQARPDLGASPPPGLPPRASPAARRRAAELGVDLAALAANLAGAPIRIEDVERAAGEAAGPTSASAPTGGPVEGPPEAPSAPSPARAPQQAMRDAIAAAMARSNREIPHYYLGAEIDVEASLAWLEAFNAGRPPAERVLFVALVLRAIAQALREVPDLNGSYVDGHFRRSEAIHIGVVTALRGGGLVVPAVHDVDRLEPPALMAVLRDVLSRARSGQLRSSDLADSTITVSNMGDLGVETVYGVIYPPQVALVGLGRVAARPVVRDGAVVAARTMHVTLSGDHRVTDGLVGARFLSALRERLERPEAA
ncbi:2-oxo acid dehydrogenase subunit E2 [Burkholderiaceae bacterium FT117]|uniref:dihydrolipoamide acetyltransferase family protein n=1 Tax=Zeimonas sediminis TaxID=2944268 RepID=UPI002342EAE1|nr:dihydrolipoamide acetyltransferase family protein [Zeimonas sediminis]MCM5571277.1 2-oxo acid dehydrogenase subunit E2 [Zeimonas sediminis]